MKTIVLMIVMLALTGASYGQKEKAMTVKELKGLNAAAQWVKVDENAETDEPIYVDSNAILRNKHLVFFRTALETDMGYTIYTMVGGNCITKITIFNNIFIQQDNDITAVTGAKLSPPSEAKDGTLIHSALRYACNFKKGGLENVNMME